VTAARLRPVPAYEPAPLVNPRAGLRRDPGEKPLPPVHVFVTTGYVIWIGGVPTRRMKAAPGGFQEVRP